MADSLFLSDPLPSSSSPLDSSNPIGRPPDLSSSSPRPLDPSSSSPPLVDDDGFQRVVSKKRLAREAASSRPALGQRNLRDFHSSATSGRPSVQVSQCGLQQSEVRLSGGSNRTRGGVLGTPHLPARSHTNSLRRNISRSVNASVNLPSVSLPSGVVPPSQDRKCSTWADLVKEDGSCPIIEDELPFIPPINLNNKKIVALKESVTERTSKKWEGTILVYVFGIKPNYLHFKAYVSRVWKIKSNFEMYTRSNGFFLIKFANGEDCDLVLKNGPYLFGGRIVMMRRWSNNFSFDRDLLASIPIWIILPDVNLKIWDKEAFCAIASAVGKPIKLDEATLKETRLSYARILVEINAVEELPNEVFISLYNGESLTQPIIYEWLPPRCSACVCFGHTKEQCSVQQEWRVKANKKMTESSDKQVNPSPESVLEEDSAKNSNFREACSDMLLNGDIKRSTFSVLPHAVQSDVCMDAISSPPVLSSLGISVTNRRHRKSKSMKDLLSVAFVKDSRKVKHKRGMKPSSSFAVLSVADPLNASGLPEEISADCLTVCNPVAIDPPDPESRGILRIMNVEIPSEVGLPSNVGLVSSDVIAAPCSHSTSEIHQQVTDPDLYSSKRKLPDSFMKKYISVNPAWEEMSKQLVLYGASDGLKGKQGSKSAKRV